MKTSIKHLLNLIVAATLLLLWQPLGVSHAATLVSQWSFENNLNDTSGNGNHGTPTGSPSFVAGKFGQGIGMVQADKIQKTSANNLPLGGTAPWSMNLWLYLTNAPQSLAYIAGFGDPAATGAGQSRGLLAFGDPSSQGIYFWGGGSGDFATGQAYPLGRWVMLTVTYDGTNVRVYQDAAIIGTAARTLANVPSAVISLAPASQWNADLAGAFDECTVWSGTLTPAEITNLFSGPVITGQPAGYTRRVGDAAVNLAVTAASSTALSYQWRKDGAAISGATSATLVVSANPLAAGDAGVYSVIVSNTTCAVTSQVAVVTVLPALPVATNGLIGYWSFDEGAGAAAFDRSTNGNNGVLMSSPAWTTGQVGGALNFVPANGSYVIVTNYPKPTATMTVSAWVWANSRPAWASIAKNWTGAGLSFHFGISDSGYLGLHLKDGTAGTPNAYEGTLFPTNSWQHVAYVCDGANIRIYRNGAQVATTTYNGVISTAGFQSFAIGAKQLTSTTADSVWDGRIDEVGMWNRSLDSNEIAAVYAAGAGGKPLLNAGASSVNATVLTDVGEFAFPRFLRAANATSKGWLLGPNTIPASVSLNGATLVANIGTNDPVTGLSYFSAPATYAISGYTWTGSDQQSSRDNLSKGGFYGGTGDFAMKLAATAGKTYVVEMMTVQNSTSRSMNVAVDGAVVVTNWTVVVGAVYNRILRLKVVADADGIDLAFTRGTVAGSDNTPAISAIALTELAPGILADETVSGFPSLLATTNASSKGWNFGNTTANAPTTTLNGAVFTSNLGVSDPATGLTFTGTPGTYAVAGYSWAGSDQQAAREALTKGGLYAAATDLVMKLGAAPGHTYILEYLGVPYAGNRSMDLVVDGATVVDEMRIFNGTPLNRLVRYQLVADADGIDVRIKPGTTGADNNPIIEALALTDLTPTPGFLAQPQSINRWEREPGALNGLASCSLPMTYQWYQNDVPVLNATNATLAWSSLAASNAGSYIVVVSTASLSVTSAPAVVTVQVVAAIPDGMIAYWNFDEANGTVLHDLTAGGSHGSLSNYVGDNSQWISGQIGGALRFYGAGGTGSNNFVLVTNYPKPSVSMTASAWVWADSRPTWGTIIKNWTTSGYEFHFGLDDNAPIGELSNYLGQQGNSSVGPVRESGTIFPVGSWQHVAFVCDGKWMQLYHNGVAVGSAVQYSGTINTNVIPFLGIGAKLLDSGVPSGPGDVGYWQGKMDDMGLWTRGLTANEIFAIYQAGTNGVPLTSAALDSAPTITLPPQGFTRYAGEYGPSLSGLAVGTQPVSYQWLQDGVPLPNQTNTTLTLGLLGAGNAGNYALKATNYLGSVTSAPAIVTVTVPASVSDGLGTYWNFDDASGTALADRSGNGADGTLQNYVGDDTQWVSGQIGGALRFYGAGGTGSNNWVNVPTYSKPYATMTISAWVWADSRPGFASIIKNWPGVNSQFHFGLEGGNGDLSNYLRDQNGTQLGPVREGAGTPLPLGSWQQVALVCDGRNMQLYRNGVAVGTPFAYNGTINTNPVYASLAIGAKYAGSVDSYWQGKMDDMGLWKRGLTSNEIFGIYMAGLRGLSLSNATSGPQTPLITLNPQSVTRYENEFAPALSATAFGTPPLFYQWQQNGADVPGATNLTLDLGRFTNGTGGNFTFIATNAGGSVTSAPAVVVAQLVSSIADGLGNYWNFDEGSGAMLIDNSGVGGNDGALLNFPEDNSQWVSGPIGGALRFDGTNYVDVSNYVKPSSTMTISAWVWADARLANASIIKNWVDTFPTTRQFYFGLDNITGNSDVSLYIQQQGGTAVGPTREGTPLPTNSWQHVAVVCDGKVMQLYRNGVAVGTPVAYNSTLNTNPVNSYLSIGAKHDGPNVVQYWQGKMDDLGLWQRGLASNEIFGIYMAGLSELPLTDATSAAQVPVVTSPPQGVTRYAGESARLSVTVAGTPPFSYQWRKGGFDILNANSNSFVLTNLVAEDAASYDVVITNIAGNVTSASAAVAVLPVPNMNTGLGGYWNFDDGTGGVAFDQSGLGNNGGLTNFPTDGSQWIAGELTGALNFRGSGDYVWVTNYSKPTSTMTMSAWVWANSRPGWASIAKNWSGPNGQFHFGLQASDGDLSSFVWQTDGTTVGPVREGTNSPFPLGSWQHVVFVADGALMKLYRNGQLVGTPLAYNGTIETNGMLSGFAIGGTRYSNGTAGQYWNGKIDEVALWSRGLTDAEILALYQANTNGQPLLPTTVGNFPAITVNPAGGTRYAGEYFSMSANGAGEWPLSFRWQKDGADVPDATNRTLTFPQIGTGEAGTYTFIASNMLGTATSAPAVVVVQAVAGITEGLGGYWPFDEGAGTTAVDWSGIGNDGTLMNYTNDSQWVPVGRIGGALGFGGLASSNYVIVTDYPKPSSTMTVSAWVWADARPTWATIVKNWPYGVSDEFHFGLRADAGNLNNYLVQGGGGQAFVDDASLFPLGSWQHVAFVCDGSQMRLYRNGAQVGAAAYNGTINTNGIMSLMGIGAKLLTNGLPAAGLSGTVPADGSFWQGKMDDVALWTRGLTPAEIQAIYVAGNGGFSIQEAVVGATPPGITSVLPVTATVECNSGTNFTVVPSGDGPFHYQWYLNGSTALPGQTSDTLTIANASPAGTTNYYSVVVMNIGGAVTSAPVILAVTDTTPPQITCSGNIVTNTTGSSQVVEWWTSATDNCAITNLACTPPSGSPIPVGTNPVTCTAWDSSSNTSVCTFTITVLQTVVSGQVTLEWFAGLAGDGHGDRDVTFSATGATFTNRTVQTLHFTNGVASYTLAVPPGTSLVSAKTDWNLRQAQTVVFSPGPAEANYFLPAGDLDNSNLVDIEDYFRLAAAWYTHEAAADIDGSGLVDVDDYFLLASRWYQRGHDE